MFKLSVDIIYENNSITFVLGDLKAKPNSRCKNDTNSFEGSFIDTAMIDFELDRKTQGVTLVLNLWFFSIDMTFTSKPNLTMETEIDLSVHLNYHYQTMSGKNNLSIFYPPFYKRTVLYFEKRMLLAYPNSH